MDNKEIEKIYNGALSLADMLERENKEISGDLDKIKKDYNDLKSGLENLLKGK